MTIIGELEKLREFLKTRVPYIAALIGIFVAVGLLETENSVVEPYLERRDVPVFGATDPAGGDSFELSVCTFNYGWSSFDVVNGLAGGFAVITSAPAIIASHALMSIDTYLNSKISGKRAYRTFAFILVYFNAYSWMAGAFLIFSVHRESHYMLDAGTITTLEL